MSAPQHGSSEPTCVGRRRARRQSRYCYGHRGWREARGCPHPNWWVDPLLAPVAWQTGAHARAGAVRWRWYMGALLRLGWVASILRMVESILIRWRTIGFRSHLLAGTPSMGKLFHYVIPRMSLFIIFTVVNCMTILWGYLCYAMKYLIIKSYTFFFTYLYKKSYYQTINK